MPSPAAPACFIFSHAERAVRQWAQHPPGSPLPPLRPPASVYSACLRLDGTVPTLATGRSNHPQYLHPPGFFSTRTLFVGFGLRPRDPLLLAAVRIAHPGRAQEAICRGVDLHVICPILHLLRSHPRSPLRDVPRWDVITAFSGADVFCGGLRSHPPSASPTVWLAPPNTSEPLPFCRALVQAVHHQLPAHAFPRDAASPAATLHAAPSHLDFWGFPHAAQAPVCAAT
mgnify:CR=1 FL=1